MKKAVAYILLRFLQQGQKTITGNWDVCHRLWGERFVHVWYCCCKKWIRVLCYGFHFSFSSGTFTEEHKARPLQQTFLNEYETHMCVCTHTHKNAHPEAFIKISIGCKIYNLFEVRWSCRHCLFLLGPVYIHWKLIPVICYYLNHTLICFRFTFSVFSVTRDCKGLEDSALHTLWDLPCHTFC